MEVKCPHCASRFKLPDQLAKPGVKLRCSVCSTVFPYTPQADNPAQGPLPDMPMKRRRVGGKWVLLLLLALVCAGAGGYWYQTRGAAQRTPPPTEQEIAQKVELLTMRNVRQYYVDNDKVGKVFVIEGRVVNEFPQPKELVTVEAAIYDKDKKPLSVKRQIAGAQLSLFQLQVLFLPTRWKFSPTTATCPTGAKCRLWSCFMRRPKAWPSLACALWTCRTRPPLRRRAVTSNGRLRTRHNPNFS